MEKQEFDLLLKGGYVIDPANNICGLMDIGVLDGKIKATDVELPICNAKNVIDVSGDYVTPGLIDMHCHIFPQFPRNPGRLSNIDPEAHLYQSGVTTAVDAGTCGWRDFCSFKEQVIDQSELRVLAFLNVASGGMVRLASEQKPEEFHPEVAAALAQTFPHLIVGIKTAHYWVGKPFDRQHPPWVAVDSAIKAAELCGKPVMVDFQPTLPGRTYPDLLLKKMRPGDIHTHIYAKQFEFIDKDGKVKDFLFKARDRGILFDLGHGAASFLFRNAIPAFQQGFTPDIISSDLYFDNVNGPVINLLSIMSKYLNIGMSLEDIVKKVTCIPAHIICRPDLGTLGLGSSADITVLRKTAGRFGFADAGNTRLPADKRLECIITVCKGKIKYNPHALGMPVWKDEKTCSTEKEGGQ